MEPLNEIISKLNLFYFTITILQQLTYANVAFGI